MSINIDTSAHAIHLYSMQQHVETISVEELIHFNEQLAELIENPLMKKEVMKRNHEKTDGALKILDTIYANDFLNDVFKKEEQRKLKQHLDRASDQLESAIKSNGKMVQGFSLEGIDDAQFQGLMRETLTSMNSDKKRELYHEMIGSGIAPGPVGDTGIKDDSDLIDGLNNFVESLTDVFLARYQEAADATTQIYTAFSELNIAISDMISKADVDSEDNTIQMDLTGIKKAVDDLYTKLTSSTSDIVKQLKAITFDGGIPGAKEMADELAEGAGLVVVHVKPDPKDPDDKGYYYLKPDTAAIDNIKEALASLGDSKNVPDKSKPNIIKVPSGTLQAFQTAVESVNSRVSSDNQTLIERLRSVTTQQQQTTQLFSSLLKEMYESNKGFINKIS